MTPLTFPIQIPGVWRGTRHRAETQVSPTGFGPLDCALLGGWPKGALIQISGSVDGLGLSVIVSSFSRFTQAGQYVALINTPHIPFAPALASRDIDLRHLLWVQPPDETGALWAMEQMTRSGLFAAVAYWGRSLDSKVERRLQLAADTGKCLAFCFRESRRDDHTYAAVKLAVSPLPDAGVGIEIQKCRGRNPGQRLRQSCDEVIQAQAA